MTTSNSPRAVAQTALLSAQKVVSPYRHLCSPKKYTQPQLLACFVLKEFFRTDYRGITAILEDSSDLQMILGLIHVPHYTTLQKASKALLKRKEIHKLITSILSIATEEHIMQPTVRIAAMDGTGFESHHESRYFVERRRMVGYEYESSIYKRFPKVGIVCDTKTHLILSGIPEQGPQFDRTHYLAALTEATKQKQIAVLVADAIYGSEKAHVFAHSLGVRAIMPPKLGRPTEKLPSGYYRRKMALRFPKKLYRNRAQVETVMSMLKRNFDSFMRARSFQSRGREILLRIFAHNVMIVLA